MKEADRDSVSLVELDRATARNVARARDKPLLVTNRHAPWIWIVSHDVWIRDRQCLDYIPDSHPLVLLRDLADRHLSQHAEALCQAAVSLNLGIGPQLLCRALVLQVLYAIPEPRVLYDNIGYNMVFRRFVGVDACAPLWPYAEFERDMKAMMSMPAMLALVETTVGLHERVSHVETKFFVDNALLDAWKARAAEAIAARADTAAVAAVIVAPASAPSAGSEDPGSAAADDPMPRRPMHASRASVPSAMSVNGAAYAQGRRRTRLRYY